MSQPEQPPPAPFVSPDAARPASSGPAWSSPASSGPTGYGHQPAVPVTGYTVPSAVVSRVPEDQPFLVWPKRKVAIFFLVLAVLYAPLTAFNAANAWKRGDVLSSASGVLAGAILVVALGAMSWGALRGGPMSGVGPHGVWVRIRMKPGRAIFVPWDSIGSIDLRRAGFAELLWISLRAPLKAHRRGVFTGHASRSGRRFGEGYGIGLLWCDRPTAEIAEALRHYSAGRCPINI